MLLSELTKLQHAVQSVEDTSVLISLSHIISLVTKMADSIIKSTAHSTTPIPQVREACVGLQDLEMVTTFSTMQSSKSVSTSWLVTIWLGNGSWTLVNIFPSHQSSTALPFVKRAG